MSLYTKEDAKYQWLSFAQSYLLLAREACQELLDSRATKHSKVVSSDWNLPYQPADLFIPIIFNVKHGIEIFLKTLCLVSGKEYIGDSHDLYQLFEDLKAKIPVNLSPVNDKDGNVVSEDEIKQFPDRMSSLEKVILKYHHCEVLNGANRRVINIYDRLNDVFRYPDNKATVEIDFAVIDAQTIENTLVDIDLIYTTLNSIGYMIEIYRKSVSQSNIIKS